MPKKQINTKTCIEGKLRVSRDDMKELFDVEIDQKNIILCYFTKCQGNSYNLYWCSENDKISGKIKGLDIPTHFASCKCMKNVYGKEDIGIINFTP